MYAHRNQIPLGTSKPSHNRFPSAQFLLGPDCWQEPTLARIVSQGKETLLTPRENALLSLLLSAPYQWHQTGDLADMLAKRCGVEEISLQSIRQTIKGLRSKLGASTASPDLLRCRPGHGYGIFPPDSANTPLDTLASICQTPPAY